MNIYPFIDDAVAAAEASEYVVTVLEIATMLGLMERVSELAVYILALQQR